MNIFAYHPYRKLKLQKGLSKLEKSKIPDFNKNRITGLLNEISYLTSLEISHRLELSYWCTKKHLLELYYSNKVNRIEGSGIIPNRWFI